jgi:Flp pilus assembly protein TadD
MKRSSTFILGSLMALSLAACRSSRDDGTADDRMGATDSAAMTRDSGSMDTTMSGGAGGTSDTVRTTDTTRTGKDTTSR